MNEKKKQKEKKKEITKSYFTLVRVFTLEAAYLLW